MSFMIKIAFALSLTVAAALGHGTSTSTSASSAAPAEQAASTSTSTPIEQATPEPVLNRNTCAACDSVYDNCILEGITPAGCHRLTANCYKNCL
jgi:hypothetical protein